MRARFQGACFGCSLSTIDAGSFLCRLVVAVVVGGFVHCRDTADLSGCYNLLLFVFADRRGKGLGGGGERSCLQDMKVLVPMQKTM